MAICNTPRRTQTLDIILEGDLSSDHPNYDYSKHAPWYKLLILLITLDIMTTTTIHVVLVAFRNDPSSIIISLKPSKRLDHWFPINNAILLVLYILFCLMIDTFKQEQGAIKGWFSRKTVAKALSYIVFTSISCSIIFYNVSTVRRDSASGICDGDIIMWVTIAIYILVSLILRLLT